jgi:hypothetical protein
MEYVEDLDSSPFSTFIREIALRQAMEKYFSHLRTFGEIMVDCEYKFQDFSLVILFVTIEQTNYLESGQCFEWTYFHQSRRISHLES